MSYFVYILYSKAADNYYIGQTSSNIESRLNSHNSGKYQKSSTRKANDWEVFWSINCVSREQAIKVESHIKRMKSRVYLENLTKYPEMTHKLLNRYKD